MICQNCHEENIDVAVSCHKCGKRMAASGQGAVSNKKICVQCGSELNDDDCFCMQCGAAAGPSAGAGDEAGAALEQENESHDAQISANIPFVTWLITALIIACSGWVFWRTSSLMDVSAEALLKFGGNFEALTSSGEEWRLWSSTFLHGGLMHLAMNIACLLSFGPLLERMAGHVKFLSLYLVAAIGASAISMKFNGDVVSIGASGAIFGIFASLMIYVLVMGRRFGLTGDSIWAYLKEGFIFVGVNLAYSLRPGIDMSAHLGGLLVGAVAGLLIAIIDFVEAKFFSRLINCALAVFCAIVISTMTYSWIKSDSWIGSESENHSLEYKLNSSSAEKWDATAQFNLGLNYYKGQGVEQDYVEAAKYFRKAAEQGNELAQYNLGLMYYKGQGVEQDYAEAAKYFRKAAEQGDASAQSNLGVMYANGQCVEQDYAEAVKWYRKAADQGNASAQCNLGLIYTSGRGVSKDDYEAVKWYRKAAEQGDAIAQYNLGVMYANGCGVAKDDYEAVKWYCKAAEQGFAMAQSNLGLMFANGQGVEQDYAEAVKWYRKAVEQGYASAQYNLGVMYVNGQGVTKNEYEAFKWFRKAAEQGNVQGQLLLGIMYAEGVGVTKDDIEAERWLRKAAAQGDENVKAEANNALKTLGY